ncbi:MAG TPA: hypothetical protein PLU27_00765 [Ginsengibacter sp.]|nr:hypothetical protein [Ginsengibacter sp.]HRP43275.1 hypothetical protein [Ginsengibacter sp.]
MKRIPRVQTTHRETIPKSFPRIHGMESGSDGSFPKNTMSSRNILKYSLSPGLSTYKAHDSSGRRQYLAKSEMKKASPAPATTKMMWKLIHRNWRKKNIFENAI